MLTPRQNLEIIHTDWTMAQPHFLLVAFPAQGHINPALEFANRLIRNGACVTMVTCTSARQRMTNKLVPDSLAFALFSDGYDDGFQSTDDGDADAADRYLSEVKRRGSQYITELIMASAGNRGLPFTCLVYTLLNTWVAEVARKFQLRSVLLWVQPASVLDIYYYYFNGYAEVISSSSSSDLVELPGLPPLHSHDLPSFMLPSNTYTFGLPSFQEQVKRLSEQTKPKILINTFDALESVALKAIESFIMVGIGPLIPLTGKDSSNGSKEDYMEWLNLKPNASVVFVSFGSIAVLSKKQHEELEWGLLDSKHPFLWVVREKEEEKLSCREELERQGMIVPWCSQVDVLSHPSIGCFISHCGWNSTLESLAAGVPIVALPQWVDQPTNAKMVEDVWKTGLRVVHNEEGIAQGDEIKRCLEIVMGGEKSEELRRNARKWKDFAAEAVKDGGSSDKNLKAFVNEVRQEYQTGSSDSN